MIRIQSRNSRWRTVAVAGGGLIALLGLALGGCSSSSRTAPVNTSAGAGEPLVTPPLRLASLNAADFAAQLNATATGQQLLQLAGTPACGVDFYYLRYGTRGAAGESTTASGALMVPTGPAGSCSGARPFVLYAHGTSTDKAYNIADITNSGNSANSESALIAAVFAAQGYIVVAPNFAGYDDSTLTYHPYLVAGQQAGEMMDALQAGRTALAASLSSATTDGGKVFVTGYSEGGYVALATTRAMQAAGQAVAATAGGSGPYALEAFGDAIFLGQVNLGSTIFAPLLVTAYQHAYGNIYKSTSDIFTSTYASGIDTLLPSTTPLGQLFAGGKLPQTALFDSMTPVIGNPKIDAVLAVPTVNPAVQQTAIFALGFGEPNLVNNSYRLSYALDALADPDGALTMPPTAGAPLAAAPQQPLRHALWTNDLRNGGWIPNAPLLMCGGDHDPTVFFRVNTQVMQAFWAAKSLPPGLVTVLDLQASASGPFALLQGAFQQAQAQELAFLESPAGGGLTPAQAQAQAIQGYHGGAAPFCVAAARGFFAAF